MNLLSISGLFGLFLLPIFLLIDLREIREYVVVFKVTNI